MDTIPFVPYPFSRRYWSLFLLFPLALWLLSCTGTSSSSSGTGNCPAVSSLRGAGSTFDEPLFTKLFNVYPSTPCGLTVNYYAVGSGTGTAQLLGQLTDFAATDAPLTDRQLASSPNGAIVHVPITLGVVAVGYHLTGISGSLRLNSSVLAAIYLGTITYWDDPAIQQLNPGVALPHEAIQVFHRSDSSGTTAIFTHYLAEVSSTWKTRVGASTSVAWPTGQGEQGSGGVAGAVESTEGAIGYVEWSYVVNQHLSAAMLQNQAGVFLSPSLAGAQAAAAAFPTIPADLRFYLVNAPGAEAYPISGYSWVIVYQQQSDAEKGKALANLLWWMVHQGQQYAQPLSYAPLPATIVTRDEGQIRQLVCGSTHQSCYQGQ